MASQTPPPENGTQWLEIADFRAGIFSNHYSDFERLRHTAPQAPLGAAQLGGTEGCVASPTGSLVPGPRWMSSKTYDVPFPHTVNLAYNLASTIVSPVTDNTINNFPGTQPDLLYIGTAAQTDAFESLSVTFHSHWMGGGGLVTVPDYHWTQTHLGTAGQSGDAVPGGVSICRGLSDKGPIQTVTPPTTNFAAYPFVFCGTSAWVDDFNALLGSPSADNLSVLFVSPHPDFPGSPVPKWPLLGTVAATSYGGGEYNGILTTMHQGRLVWATREIEEEFDITTSDVPDQVWSNTFDVLKYQPSTNCAAIDATFPTAAAYLADGSGISIIASMDANTLLVIKNHGGGYLIRGDLDRPQVTRLAGIVSTYGRTSLGVVTPVGFVYGARDGMFAWGGDTSTNATSMSDQLPGTFWLSDLRSQNAAFAPEQPLGKFNYRQPYVLCPSDFLYDTRTKGFWKLTRPAATGHGFATWGYEVSSTGNVYAITDRITNVDKTIWNFYDFTVPETHYIWTSQPLAMAKERNMQIRELGCKLEGIGAVTFRILGYDDEELFQYTFNCTTHAPTTFRTNVAVDLGNGGLEASANDIRLEITSVVSTDSSDSDQYGAPAVHFVRLGTITTQDIPVS